jgi:hypothetical protein
MRLSHKMPRCSVVVSARVTAALEVGCPCGGEVARFTQRTTSNGVLTVHVQCETCGRSLTGSIARDGVPFYRDFPKWDDELPKRYYSADRPRLLSSEDRMAAWQERRDAYSAWLETSSEWRCLRQRIHQRAGNVCEACLVAPSAHVHHDTYDIGILPPAWKLRAVCKDCHRRLHTGWMVAGSPILWGNS